MTLPLRPVAPPFDPAEVPSELNPPVASLYRGAWPTMPDATLASLIDTLQTSPHHAVPVVNGQGALLGMVSDADAARALLNAPDPEARARVRSLPAIAVMHRPDPLLLHLTARQALREFERQGQQVLPVVDETGTFRGLVARADLAPELVRPFRPPQIGGMATPLGVYLTTGRVSGGVGWHALFLYGLCLGLITLAASLLTLPLLPVLNGLPTPARSVALEIVQRVVPLLLLFVAIRFSNVSGYHAAEHQVVHAIERGEPLTVEAVRQMPRVHPRCGTNFTAAGLIVFGLGGLLAALLGRWGQVGYLIAGLVALSSWREVGAWLQKNVTTRPATTKQIESGLAAARDVLSRHSRAPYARVTPLSRLWRMGLVQILAGFFASGLLFYILGLLLPPLRSAVNGLL